MWDGRGYSPIRVTTGRNMPRSALTHDDLGREALPAGNRDWDSWVSATRTRNHILDHPLLDWLDRHGKQAGYQRDVPDPRTDYLSFLFRKGHQFEYRVIGHLQDLYPRGVRVITPSDISPSARRSLTVAHATWEAMKEAAPIIYQGSLRDAHNLIYGSPDLLVRSDILVGLFPDCLDPDLMADPAPDLDIGDRHYVVVDIKYSTLSLNSRGTGLLNSGSAPAYKAQVFLYSRALGRIQGYHPERAFLLGRGWRMNTKGIMKRGDSAMERLGPVILTETRKGETLEARVDGAAAWMRRMRRDGHLWKAVPPSVEELRPKAKDKMGQWTSAVKEIAEETRDLTRLWNVGVAQRQRANRLGLTEWTDPRVTTEALGLNGRRAQVLRAILDVNRRADLPPVMPPRVEAARSEWGRTPDLEFYVDFETVSDIYDDFGGFPRKSGQALIFMIGCGHMERGEWRFECFVADQLTEPAEVSIVEAWFEHMEMVGERLAPDSNPKVIHWSSAEGSSLDSAYNAARIRHSRGREWPEVNWFDFLSRVIRAEPVVVRGSHGFGLKEITNALHNLGMINCRWGSGPADGLGAMVGAWWCQDQIYAGRAVRLTDIDLMKEIGAYNEVDCRAMMENVYYLRRRGGERISAPELDTQAPHQGPSTTSG